MSKMGLKASTDTFIIRVAQGNRTARQVALRYYHRDLKECFKSGLIDGWNYRLLMKASAQASMGG